MKKIICVLSLFAAFINIGIANAATVEVYPSIETAYGNNHPMMMNPSAKDIKTQIVQGSWSDSQYGVPTYVLPGAGSYQVQFFPPTGYTYTTDGNCEGTIAANQDIVCNVDYIDGSPQDSVFKGMVLSHPPIPSEQPTQPMPPIVQPVVQQPAPTSAATSPAAVSTNSTVVPPTDASTTAAYVAQVQALQAQISQLLQQLITLLTAKLMTLQGHA